MFQQNHMEAFIENRELHQDYYTLIEEYSSTTLYKEIIHFMYLAFPEWTSNKGIGYFAAEFVLTSILNLEYVYEDNKMTSTEKFIDIYLSLVEDYHNTKSNFALSEATKIVDDFERDCDFELDTIEHLENNDYTKAYNALYKKFEENYLKQIAYNFIDEEDIVL